MSGGRPEYQKPGVGVVLILVACFPAPDVGFVPTAARIAHRVHLPGGSVTRDCGDDGPARRYPDGQVAGAVFVRDATAMLMTSLVWHGPGHFEECREQGVASRALSLR